MTNYQSMTISDLKEVCKSRKISCSGNKSDIIKKIEWYDKYHNVKFECSMTFKTTFSQSGRSQGKKMEDEAWDVIQDSIRRGGVFYTNFKPNLAVRDGWTITCEVLE